ncbi:MFS transporter [Fulvivirga sp. M361]|uniref:MFS transporter n=1 Tax=Fulvivirga sp. M361 TaxID=2594266 RepID=UPI001C887BF5|nr:MFS transporter [Fulvivirga sp. M361]
MNKTIIPIRYLVVLGTFLLSLLLYIDRVCISVAKEPIQGSLSLTETQMGWVLSIFALGYALFQTPSGIMADRFGPRVVLSSIVTIWSVFTALTGVAWNFITLLITRLFFGAGEAGAFPSMARAIFNWIPLAERGLVTGINFSGSRLGAAFALPLVAWMINDLGWRNSFYLLGAIGLVWALIWYFVFRDSPDQQPLMPAEERDYILQNRQKNEGTREKVKLKLGIMLRSKNMQLAMLQYFCSNFTFFFALTWLFPHVKETYHLNAVEAGFYTSAPLIFGAIGNWFSGWLVDFLYKKGIGTCPAASRP